MGTSEASFASILDLQRTLFYDLKNFNYSEISNLPLSEFYFLTLTGPHEKNNDAGGRGGQQSPKDVARNSMNAMKRFGLA